MKTSLILLKTNALKAAFKVPFLVTQKFIKTKEVRPISSQPINKSIRFETETKNIILKIKLFKNKINRSINGSYLKYAKVYSCTKYEIDKVSII